MHRADAVDRRARIRIDDDVDRCARPRRRRQRIACGRPLSSTTSIAQQFGHELEGRRRSTHGHRHAVQAAHAVVLVDAVRRPRRPRSSALPTSSNLRPDGSRTADASLAESRPASSGATPCCRSRARQNAERRRRAPRTRSRRPVRRLSCRPARPDPCRGTSSRSSPACRARAVIEVVDVVVVEVDGLLDEPQTEQAEQKSRSAWASSTVAVT